jgi:transcription antitermination factor NusG
MPDENGGALYTVGENFDSDHDCGSSPIAWYGARVRSRSELTVASFLTAKDVECFVPCWQQRRAYSDRVRNVPVAAFPGYLFCRIGPTERTRVLSTQGVQSLAGTRQAGEPIEDETILALQRAFSQAELVTQVPYLRLGDGVRVLDGPMAGAIGTLLRVKGQQRLVISLDVLQRSVAVEVDGASVELLSKTSADLQ